MKKVFLSTFITIVTMEYTSVIKLLQSQTNLKIIFFSIDPERQFVNVIGSDTYEGTTELQRFQI